MQVRDELIFTRDWTTNTTIVRHPNGASCLVTDLVPATVSAERLVRVIERGAVDYPGLEFSLHAWAQGGAKDAALTAHVVVYPFEGEGARVARYSDGREAARVWFEAGVWRWRATQPSGRVVEGAQHDRRLAESDARLELWRLPLRVPSRVEE